MDEHCGRKEHLPDSVEGRVSDWMDETETFRAGVKTTGGTLTRSVWLVVTSSQLVTVETRLIDASLGSVPLTAIADLEASSVDLPAERRHRVEIETVDDTITHEVHDPDGAFVEELEAAVAAVPDPALADPAYPSAVDDAVRNCERVVDAAERARRDASFAEADERYEVAIAGYRTILERLPAADERREAIEETVAELRERREETSEAQRRRETLRSRLVAAEASFQTAVRAHANRERTVAKIRYRQARDDFEEAVEAFGAAAPEVTTPIEVAPDTSAVAASGPLAEVSVVPVATANVLQEHGYRSVADLQAAAAGPTTSTAGSDSGDPLRDRIDSLGIDRDHAPVLLALGWQHAGSVAFTGRTDVEQRSRQAVTGYEATV